MSKKAGQEVPKKDKNQIIADLEKAKEALTQAQKDLEDEKYKDAIDCLCAAKLYNEVAIKQTRLLWEEQQKK